MASLGLWARDRGLGAWGKGKGVLGMVLKDSNVVSLQINTAGIMVMDRMVRNALGTNRTYVRVCAGVQATVPPSSLKGC